MDCPVPSIPFSSLLSPYVYVTVNCASRRNVSSMDSFHWRAIAAFSQPASAAAALHVGAKRRSVFGAGGMRCLGPPRRSSFFQISTDVLVNSFSVEFSCLRLLNRSTESTDSLRESQVFSLPDLVEMFVGFLAYVYHDDVADDAQIPERAGPSLQGPARCALHARGTTNDAPHTSINVGFKNTRQANCTNTSVTNGIRVHSAVSPFPVGSNERWQVALFFCIRHEYVIAELGTSKCK